MCFLLDRYGGIHPPSVYHTPAICRGRMSLWMLHGTPPVNWWHLFWGKIEAMNLQIPDSKKFEKMLSHIRGWLTSCSLSIQLQPRCEPPNLWLLLSPRSLELVHSISAIWRVFVVLRTMTNRSLRTTKIGQIRSETVGHQKLGITTNVGCDLVQKSWDATINHQGHVEPFQQSKIAETSMPSTEMVSCSYFLRLSSQIVRLSDCP